jgi:hypothetical protein
MKSRKSRKPTIPQPEQNALIQLLRKSDRLLERELKDYRKEEKDLYNQDVRIRTASKKVSHCSPVKSQEVKQVSNTLPSIQVPISGTILDCNLSPSVEHNHMAAFTPRLVQRPKTATRNNVLGKDGVNYFANSQSSYQRLANQYSTRRTPTFMNTVTSSERLPSPSPAVRRSSPSTRIVQPRQGSSHILTENIQIVPSSSIRQFLEATESPVLSPIPPANIDIVQIPICPLPVSDNSHPIPQKKSKRPSTTNSMRLPVQMVNIQLLSTAVNPSDPLVPPLSARSVQSRGYDDRAMLRMLPASRTSPGAFSPKELVLSSPEQNRKSLDWSINNSPV